VLPVAWELNRVRGLKPTGMGRDNLPVPAVSNDRVRPSADVVNSVDAGIWSKWHGDSLVAWGDAKSIAHQAQRVGTCRFDRLQLTRQDYGSIDTTSTTMPISPPTISTSGAVPPRSLSTPETTQR
jgi:hypothetical protein